MTFASTQNAYLIGFSQGSLTYFKMPSIRTDVANSLSVVGVSQIFITRVLTKLHMCEQTIIGVCLTKYNVSDSRVFHIRLTLLMSVSYESILFFCEKYKGTLTHRHEICRSFRNLTPLK